jgi:cell division protein FtsI (penicillin-binding protein 3)
MMQLAQAYSILANKGIAKPITFLKVNSHVTGVRVIDENIIEQVIPMLESVVQTDGGGRRAAVEGYRVAGKTGTAHKAEQGGYADDRYMSLFAGFAPASNPRLVTVLMIDEPQSGEHYGGQVAAPVFSSVMKGALRIMNIPPDKLESVDERVTMVNRTRQGL